MKWKNLLMAMGTVVFGLAILTGCEKKTEEPKAKSKAPEVKTTTEPVKTTEKTPATTQEKAPAATQEKPPAVMQEKTPEAVKTTPAVAEKSVAELEKMKPADMTVDQLKTMAANSKDGLALKQKELNSLKDQFKAIPATDLLGDKAKSLKDKIEKLTKEIADLQAKHQSYIGALKDKKVDIKGLE
jgi:hypothetical protein